MKYVLHSRFLILALLLLVTFIVVGYTIEANRQSKVAASYINLVELPTSPPTSPNITTAALTTATSTGDIPDEKMSVESKLKVWKTIKLGTGYKTGDDFRRAFDKSGMIIYAFPDEFFKVSKTEISVDLVNISPADLGFKGETLLTDFHKRAQKLGLSLCPSEVGLQLRLQYKDQPQKDFLWVGMDPFIDSNGESYAVFLVHGGGDTLALLSSNISRPTTLVSEDTHYVFIKK